MCANHLLSHAEKNWEDVTNRQTFNVGLCSGLFAATAVASTPSLSTLVPVAVEIVLMAFRVGTHVHSLAEKLSPTAESSDSWTHIYPGVKESQASTVLAEFHKFDVSPHGARPSSLQPAKFQ
jgi:hypothetical protein